MLYREMLWIEAKDVWCIHLEPVWGDFYGTRAVGKDRAIPFLDAFPLTLWVSTAIQDKINLGLLGKLRKQKSQKH